MVDITITGSPLIQTIVLRTSMPILSADMGANFSISEIYGLQDRGLTLLTDAQVKSLAVEVAAVATFTKGVTLTVRDVVTFATTYNLSSKIADDTGASQVLTTTTTTTTTTVAPTTTTTTTLA